MDPGVTCNKKLLLRLDRTREIDQESGNGRAGIEHNKGHPKISLVKSALRNSPVPKNFSGVQKIPRTTRYTT